jgi:hypothetical protein
MYLVLKVDGRVEVGDLCVDGLAEHLALDVVDKLAHLCELLAMFRINADGNCAHTEDLVGRTERGAAAEATASCRQISYCTSLETLLLLRGLHTTTGSEAAPAAAAKAAAATASRCSTERHVVLVVGNAIGAPRARFELGR